MPVKNGALCIKCHAPAADGAMGTCLSPKASAWTLVATGQALCATCHDTSAATPHPVLKSQVGHDSHSTAHIFGPDQHPVIKSDGCTVCHDPHASINPKLTRRWPLEPLCYKCHAKYDDAAFIHTAVQKGECLGCHSPHRAVASPLLLASRQELCFSCHKSADLLPGRSKHPPVVAGRCIECHDPHRADEKFQLVEKGKKLCLGCHDAKGKITASSPGPDFRIDLSKKVVHKPVGKEDCQECHTQKHSSDNERLLLKPIAETCYRCHTRFDDMYKFQHTPAKKGECTGCHDPHSSDTAGLLKQGHINDLCFSCHKDNITKREWIHAPITEKGCTACHDAHGGDYANDLSDGEGDALCLKCHKGVGVNIKVKHKVMESGCIKCHDAHASDQPGGLLKATNELCVSCHEKQADGAHVTGMKPGVLHKISGGLDEKRAGRAFSCVSCHNPHGSDNAKLFYKGQTATESCAYCHEARSP